jgi:acetyl esterase
VREALEAWTKSGAPSARATPLVEAREGYAEATAAFDPSPPEVGSTEELVVDGADGPMRARLYIPTSEAPEPGLVLWLHGGGWIQGGIESHDRSMRHLAESSKQRFLVVEYRLAPEHPFPAGLDDAEAALRWVLAHAEDLGAGSDRVAIGGDSAGATLALVSALACGRGQLHPALQILCYPPMGPELMTESHHDFDHDFGLSADDMAYFYEQYLPPGQSHADPRVSPLLTPDLHEAPPTLLTVAGFDPLRDEGLALAGLLEGSGVSVELLDESSLIHGYLCLGGLDAGRAAIERLGQAIGRHLAG